MTGLLHDLAVLVGGEVVGDRIKLDHTAWIECDLTGPVWLRWDDPFSIGPTEIQLGTFSDGAGTLAAAYRDLPPNWRATKTPEVEYAAPVNRGWAPPSSRFD